MNESRGTCNRALVQPLEQQTNREVLMPTKQKYQILRRVARAIIVAGVVNSILSIVFGALALPSVIQHDSTGWLTFLSILGTYLSFVLGMVVAAGGQLLIVFVETADSLVEIKLNTDELSEMVEDALEAGNSRLQRPARP